MFLRHFFSEIAKIRLKPCYNRANANDTACIFPRFSDNRALTRTHVNIQSVGSHQSRVESIQSGDPVRKRTLNSKEAVG